MLHTVRISFCVSVSICLVSFEMDLHPFYCRLLKLKVLWAFLVKKISFKILSLRTFISCHHNLFLDCIIADNACFIWYLVKIRVHYPTEKAIGVIIDQNIYFHQFPNIHCEHKCGCLKLEWRQVLLCQKGQVTHRERNQHLKKPFRGISNMIEFSCISPSVWKRS